MAQKLEAVAQLAGGVAHDFNNLLTVISTYTTLLLETAPADDPAREDLGEIASAAERATTLTSQLLAFGRRQLLAPRLLDLNVVIRDMSEVLRRFLPAGIDLDFAFDDSLDRVWADRGQVEQVLLNLILNARDAMPNGGRLSVATRNVAQAGSGERWVLLDVRDSGMGMDATTQARIFDPFFTTKRPGKGTGLGLSTALGIVRQSGGDLEVESALGAGCRVTIRLPGLAAPANTTGLRKPAAPIVHSGRVLLAEDDDAVRRIVARTLEATGYSVIAAADGAAAIAEANAWREAPRLLVTDLIMPRVGGAELASTLRRRWPDLPTVFISAYASPEASGGAGDFPGVLLHKPFVPADMIRAVEEALAAA
ncbi:MAG: response regulator [Gemmatimonadetes bacterium]|nr:response regulator [Gemmatimonadota bacterium]